MFFLGQLIPQTQNDREAIFGGYFHSEINSIFPTQTGFGSTWDMRRLMRCLEKKNEKLNLNINLLLQCTRASYAS